MNRLKPDSRRVGQSYAFTLLSVHEQAQLNRTWNILIFVVFCSFVLLFFIYFNKCILFIFTSSTTRSLYNMGGLSMEIWRRVLHSEIIHHGDDVLFLSTDNYWIYYRTVYCNLPSDQSAALLPCFAGHTMYCYYLDCVNIQCLAISNTYKNVSLPCGSDNRKACSRLTNLQHSINVDKKDDHCFPFLHIYLFYCPNGGDNSVLHSNRCKITREWSFRSWITTVRQSYGYKSKAGYIKNAR